MIHLDDLKKPAEFLHSHVSCYRLLDYHVLR